MMAFIFFSKASGSIFAMYPIYGRIKIKGTNNYFPLSSQTNPEFPMVCWSDNNDEGNHKGEDFFSYQFVVADVEGDGKGTQRWDLDYFRCVYPHIIDNKDDESGAKVSIEQSASIPVDILIHENPHSNIEESERIRSITTSRNPCEHDDESSGWFKDNNGDWNFVFFSRCRFGCGQNTHLVSVYPRSNGDSIKKDQFTSLLIENVNDDILNTNSDVSIDLTLKYTPIARIVSGRVYCQDEGGDPYPLVNLPMTFVRNSLGDAIVNNTDADGNFSADLTGATGFAVRTSTAETNWALPNGELAGTEQSYSELVGPILEDKSQCQSGSYEMCDPTTTTEHTGFDFKYTNCTTPPIAPTCNDISMLDSNDGTPIDDDTPLSPGQTIKFQCSANPADAAVYYQFNIAKHNPTTGVYSSIINSPTDISSSIISSDITIDSTGDYYAQCRICTDATDEASCQDWEQTPLPPGCEPVASNMSCTNEAECIACYGQPVSCDDTEDGKRYQIPTGGFDLD